MSLLLKASAMQNFYIVIGVSNARKRAMYMYGAKPTSRRTAHNLLSGIS
jgi:bifunctional DNase/RNase